VIELLTPMEELLTVAIDNTTNTLFRAGITRFVCHNSPFALTLFNIRGIVRVIVCNPKVTQIIQEFPFLADPLNSDFVVSSLLKKNLHR